MMNVHRFILWATREKEPNKTAIRIALLILSFAPLGAIILLLYLYGDL